MRETNAVRKETAQTDDRPERASDSGANEIRLLSEFELALAGGGDNTDGWP
jgi:hypothetical protein